MVISKLVKPANHKVSNSTNNFFNLKLKQLLFSRLLVYLYSNRTHRKHGGIMLVLRNLNKLKALKQQLYRDLYGYLFLILIIFA